MPKTEAFELHTDRYELWFERNTAAFESELNAVRMFWPSKADGLDIGAGAGHFTAPLGVPFAIEPSAAMRKSALKRGVRAIDGTAEHLPFRGDRFDAVLMVTTLCFVDDPEKSAQEMFRVLRPGGCAVVAFVDCQSPLGADYERKRHSSLFYENARLFATSEVASLLTGSGFMNLEYCQTLFTHPAGMKGPDPVRAGSGEGSFVVIRGWKAGD